MNFSYFKDQVKDQVHFKHIFIKKTYTAIMSTYLNVRAKFKRPAAFYKYYYFRVISGTLVISFQDHLSFFGPQAIKDCNNTRHSR